MFIPFRHGAAVVQGLFMISLDEPFRFGSSGRMQLCFLLFLTGLHLTAACKLEGNQKTQIITAYTGSSVLLPCYCTDLQTKPEGVTWEKDNQSSWTEIRTDSDPYRYRFQLVKDQSPGNLSLIISDLTEEDEGWYRCSINPDVFTIIRLNAEVPGCTKLNDQDKVIMGYVGQSVVLPCSCTDLQAKPKNLRWTKRPDYKEIYPEDQTNLYRNRFQLVKDQPPGNLSLIISDLNKKDDRWYRCSVEPGVYIYIRLFIKEALPKTLTSTPLVKEITTSGIPTRSSTSTTGVKEITTDINADPAADPPEHLPFVPFAAVTFVILHVIVAVIFCRKRNKAPVPPASVHYSSAAGAVSLQQRRATHSSRYTPDTHLGT